MLWFLNSCLGMLEYTGLLLFGRCVCDVTVDVGSVVGLVLLAKSFLPNSS